MRLIPRSPRLGWALLVAAAATAGYQCGLRAPSVTPGLVFTVDGRAVTARELPIDVQIQLYEAEKAHYAKTRELVEEELLQRAFAEEAQRTGKTLQAVAAAKLSVGAVTKEALKDFYDKNKARIPYAYDSVATELRTHLAGEQRSEARAKLIADLERTHAVDLALAEPQAPRADIRSAGFPARGPAGVRVTLVEFGDYRCPHCQEAEAYLRPLLLEYADRLRFVFIDNPIIAGPSSRQLAQGAFCAGMQGRYWDFHDAAYDLQAQLGYEPALELAERLAFDRDAYRACLDSAAAVAAVSRGKGEAERLGLASTPTFFVNGQLARSPSAVELRTLIDAALAPRAEAPLARLSARLRAWTGRL